MYVETKGRKEKKLKYFHLLEIDSESIREKRRMGRVDEGNWQRSGRTSMHIEWNGRKGLRLGADIRCPGETLTKLTRVRKQ